MRYGSRHQMQNVIYIISVLFLETLTAAAAFTVFFVLTRDYFRRRQVHLLLFGIAFLLMTVAYGAIFVGQLLIAVNDDSLAKFLTASFQHVTAVEAMFITVAVVKARMRGPVRFAWWMLIAAATMASFGVMLFGTQVLYTIAPNIKTNADPTLYLWNFCGLAVAAATLIAPAFMRKADHAYAAIDSYFAKAGLLLAVVYVLRFIAVALSVTWLIPIASIIHLAFASYLALAALASGSTEPQTANDPSLSFQRRLLYKAVGLNAVLFWFLAYLLLSITSAYFVESSTETRRTGLRRDVHFFSQSFASNGVLFLEETTRLASVPMLQQVIGTDPATLPPSVKDFLRSKGRQRIMRIADKDGTIVFSSYDPNEIGSTLDSGVLRKALAGARTAATEREDVVGSWSVRAAVPLTFSDGTVGGVVLATDLGAALDFTDYVTISPVLASGYGYVTITGESAYASGEMVDEVSKSDFVTKLGSKKAYYGKLSNGDEVFLEPALATDGSNNGYFYVILRKALLDRDVFRIVSVVVVLIQLALAVTVAVLIFSMAAVLRPIRDLRAAVRRIEKDDYDVRLSVQSKDEIGELAGAFNHMSGAIAERTARLRDSLREQQDFLEHSVRGMRTPINIFRWTLELMRFGDTGQLNREQLEFLEQMHQTNERLVRMVQNMQDVSLLDRGRFALKTEVFRMEDVIDEVAGELAVSIRERNINLHLQHPAKPFPAVRADRSATKKAVANLISNAVKYNQQNGHIEIGMTPRSRPAEQGGGAFIEISVEDSGRGIPDDEQSRVFTRYFRARNVLGEEIEGEGLGLYIVRKLVELQGGSISFESKEGSGSTFRFLVPADMPH